MSRILFLNVWENILSFKENIVGSQILERADGCCPQRCAPLRPEFTLPANRICTNFSDLFNSELEKWFRSWELWFSNYRLSFFLQNSLILDFLISFIFIRIWELWYPFPTMLRVWIWKANQCCRRNISTIDRYLPSYCFLHKDNLYFALKRKFPPNILFRSCANQSEKLWKFSIENWSHFHGAQGLSILRLQPVL